MRLISQDGFADIPYEIAMVEIGEHEDKTCTIYATVSGRTIAVARYSTIRKGKKVLKQLEDKHLSYTKNPLSMGVKHFIPPKIFNITH